jgi:hypothetical protein
VVEVATGLALLVNPAFVVTLLLGTDLSGAGPLLARCFGIALVALGVAPAFRSLLLYNASIALYLGYLGGAGQQGGVLLWPAVALHAGVALQLIYARRERFKLG